MNIFQLSCFLAVANSLSFARAAEQMNISQPAITHQIKALESELNVKLFRRSTRLVEITPEVGPPGAAPAATRCSSSKSWRNDTKETTAWK